MPSLHRGVDTIDGIPVYLKSGVMYAFQPEIPGAVKDGIRVGTYNPETKKATWETSVTTDSWLETFRVSQTPRSRK
ncbi:MAG: hypothetical protein EBU66_09700 [Bacteroidetes bacterium]|jgi:hypothetical protein|nr:hypothetical protein [bacterium]NBP64916.1 hypothetical protein [Bacteroidota bacterium]